MMVRWRVKMADRELRLNSIHRYVKSSPTFVLEEHSHCEVPAGCGGVVLRWRNPRESVPVTIRVALRDATEARFTVDGVPPASAVPLLKPGVHVFTAEVTAATSSRPTLLLAMYHGDPRTGMILLSSPDGSFRWTPEAPHDDSWLEAGFDDTDWLPMTAGVFPDDADDRRGHQVLELGAQPLSAPAERLWMRRLFHVPAPFEH
ncbi:hypothetical protein ETD86_36370 [Nonomuraea turkmeniaca]|uniref:Uncharacterized protein n=1 Tax=Nonomuraea turkmeniaca TaxID=103838 RepID=A0A5S4F514_9ACTN|nr:hypothetical protein [Nonomuraea turkmeniaca]TMR11262.1 hypothetical protein ETD86_36370 [Nonomuraea turkmeniaca]